MRRAASFGEFFKQRREARDLTLREFCRRNGFDPGNISRLERGLLAPPQLRETLEAYAAALELRPGSTLWTQFMDWAALEGGRIPEGLRRNPKLLEEAFRRLRSGTRADSWTKSLDLRSWAGTMEAPSTLPRLVRRLIHSTIEPDAIQRIEFPAGEESQRPGWDGILETSRGNGFVPEGLSVWELGTGADSKEKAQRDFSKRSQSSTGLETGKLTFVFVTPRRWLDKEKWCQEKRKSDRWKDVRAYDASDLEAWLEIAPSVDAWFARRIGRRPEGVSDLDEHWRNLAALTYPSLSPEVFLTSHDEEINRLERWLKGPPDVLAWETRSPSEVIDFAAAYLASMENAKRDQAAARMVVVSSKDAWEALSATRDRRFVLIAHPSLALGAEMVTGAVRQGHHVLLCSVGIDRSEESPQFSRSNRYELENALASCGFAEEKAHRLARESGGSLTVLKRQLAGFASSRRPAWNEPSNASDLAPLVLAGGWDDNNAADCNVIEKLCGRPYNDVLATAHRWAEEEDPPLVKGLTNWKLASREDSWLLLNRSIPRSRWEVFQEAALEVLGEEDPRYRMPPNARWRAGLQGKTLQHSALLRRGLAETLALCGAQADKSSDPYNLAGLAESVVAALLANPGWRHWASLSILLPLLAEASPEAFLDALEKDLRRSEPRSLKLFESEGDPLFSSSPHVGLLWALEVLAWHQRYLTRTCLILALLEKDCGKAAGMNSPIRSLAGMFLPWFPQTTASAEQRFEAIAQLSRRIPCVTWQLLLALLPQRYGVALPISRPLWREWTTTWVRDVTSAEYWQQVEKIVEWLLKGADDRASRWWQLIEKVESLPSSARQQLVARLNSLDAGTWDVEARQKTAHVLRATAGKHRKYPEAEWALPTQVVDELEKLRVKFEPHDPVVRHKWLFARFPKLPDLPRGVSWREREKEIFQRRKTALEEILPGIGLSGILKLVELADDPDSVGFALGKARILKDDRAVLPKLVDSGNGRLAEFAEGYVRGSFQAAGWGWVTDLAITKWPANKIGRFASSLPFERRTWEFVEELSAEVSDHYWERVEHGYCDSHWDDIAYAASKLLDRGRPFQAINVLATAVDWDLDFDPLLLIKALQLGLKVQNQASTLPDGAAFNIQLIIERLQKDGQVASQQIAGLEWGYLRLLEGSEAAPKALFAWMKTDPEAFSRVVDLAFQSAEAQNDATPTPEEGARAEQGYRLLNLWCGSSAHIPGALEDGSIDEQELFAWTSAARQQCRENSLLEVCDFKLGELLARCPMADDGSWPCQSIGDLLEEVDSDKLFKGFAIGTLNTRGFHSKSLTEGGRQERELAAKYDAWAQACEFDWPQTAKILRQIAQTYQDQARREDEAALARL